MPRTLDREGDGVAAAETQGGDAPLELAALQFVEKRDQDAGATRADGVADGDCAAVHIDLFRVELQLACDGDGGYSEGFVQFDQINIFVAVPTGFCQ